MKAATYFLPNQYFFGANKVQMMHILVGYMLIYFCIFVKNIFLPMTAERFESASSTLGTASGGFSDSISMPFSRTKGNSKLCRELQMKI
jgi:hypothetical protein